MQIDVLTLFPKMFDAVLHESILKRAQEFNGVKLKIHNIRDYTKNRHRKVDDRPFGGGAGMVFNCQPVIDALLKVKSTKPKTKIILMSPKGKKLNHRLASQISKYKSMTLICGHYEGIDERIKEHVDMEISIGDYILTGGEIPAMVLIDSIIRLLPGVLGDKNSNIDESFSDGLLEYPHYTRPAVYNKRKVPDVLLSGNHKQINRWRRHQAIMKTLINRPDLITNIRQLEIN